MTRWLSASEQERWRAWIASRILLDEQLNRVLVEKHGLTLADYELLVRLSEAPDRRLRMSELAHMTLASRSRLSHHIDRLVQAGLVERAQCAEDRRGSFAVLTEAGWQRLASAAPDHVESVREYFLDALDPHAFEELGAACQRIADHLAPQRSWK